MDRLAKIRLALVIGIPGKKKRAQKVFWVLENSDKKLLDFFHSLVPKEAPFVYTQSFGQKRPQSNAEMNLFEEKIPKPRNSR